MKAVLRVLGVYLWVLALLVACGWGVGALFECEEYVVPVALREQALAAFKWTFVVCVVLAAVVWGCTRRERRELSGREAIVSILLIWLVTVALAALPWRVSGVLERNSDAWFEVVSGLTTTGSTILCPKAYEGGVEVPIHRDLMGFQPIHYRYFGTVAPVRDAHGAILAEGIEAVPRSLLLWRSLLSWVGGLGVVLMVVALLPTLGAGGRMLFRYGATGVQFPPLLPRVGQTTAVLIGVYVVLTLVGVVALDFVGADLSLFERITTAMSTLSTGGFSVRNGNIGAYGSLGVEIVVMAGMVFGAGNFALYYEAMLGRWWRWRDAELWSYLGLLVVLCVCVSSAGVGARQGIFQAISVMTTTGFWTENYDAWPFLAQALLLAPMYWGGMAGSTCGGFKIVRLCILWQCLRQAVATVWKRGEVRVVRVGGREVNDETARGVLALFAMMVGVSVLGVILLIWSGVDPETSFGLNAAMVNNAGASFRMAAPGNSCAFLSGWGKIVCMAWMLLGRLEFSIWFALLMPSFWRR